MGNCLYAALLYIKLLFLPTDVSFGFGSAADILVFFSNHVWKLPSPYMIDRIVPSKPVCAVEYRPPVGLSYVPRASDILRADDGACTPAHMRTCKHANMQTCKHAPMPRLMSKTSMHSRNARTQRSLKCHIHGSWP